MRGNRLQPSSQLMKALPDYKIEIIDFPEMDNKGDLSATGKALKNNKYTLCVSLHCDCDDSPAAKGAHVCYNEAIDKPLAEEIAGIYVRSFAGTFAAFGTKNWPSCT